jgi:hypothetical protein
LAGKNCFREHQQHFKQKNNGSSPAKNHPGKESSEQRIIRAKNYPAKNFPGEEFSALTKK